MKHLKSATLLCSVFLLSILLSNCYKRANSSEGVLTPQTIADIPILNFTPDVSVTKRAISSESPLLSFKSNSRVVNGFLLRSAGCGGTFSGSWASSGYHQYTTDTIRLDSVAQNTTINLSVAAYDVPNRFAVYQASTGSIVASSGWMGYANYSGPWGMSLNTPQSGALTFTRGTYSTYLLIVETVVNGTSDYYSVSIGCS